MSTVHHLAAHNLDVGTSPPKRVRRRIQTVTSALRQAQRAGAKVSAVEIGENGIRLVLGVPETSNNPTTDLDNWIAKHARPTQRR